MTNSHEPSYYEIALTNRQVIVAFVLLLLCLVAAFFSGVWVGREGDARGGDQMVRNAPPPKEEKKEGQNLEELEFFESDDAARPQQPEPTPAPAEERDTTLAEDFGADEEEPEPTPPAPPQQTPPALTAPEEDEEEIDEATPPPRPQRTPTPAPPAAEPARSSGDVVIQVFSSAEQDQAEKIRDRLVGGGHHAFLSPVEVAGRTMYRVRIGPFGSRDEAQKVAEQVRKGFKLDTWVTE